MTMTHADLAGLVDALYTDPKSVSWQYLSNPDANVYMGIIRKDEYLVAAFRGSFDLEDWFHDVLARPIDPIGVPLFKSVHEGFYGGTPEAWDILDFHYEIDDKLILIGHSLGAARAILLAGHAVARGLKPHFVCCWGEPAPMHKEGNPIVSTVSGVSYRNRIDGVPDPVTKSTTLIGYEHAYTLTDVSAPPASHRWDPLALHHFELYQSVTPDTEIAP